MIELASAMAPAVPRIQIQLGELVLRMGRRDEAWSYFSTGEDFTEDALVLQDWPSEAKEWQDENLANDFIELFAFRDKVNEKLEALRSAGEIGRSLDAYISIVGNPDAEDFQRLQRYEHALEELFIISRIELTDQPGAELAATATKATGGRCPRCWRWEPQLSNGTENTELCSRCAEALNNA